MDSCPTLGGSSGELRSSRILKMNLHFTQHCQFSICQLASRFFASYWFSHFGQEEWHPILQQCLEEAPKQQMMLHLLLHWCLWPKRWTFRFPGARLPRNRHSEHHNALRGRMFSGALAGFFGIFHYIVQTLPHDAICNSQRSSTAVKLVQMCCQVLLSSTGKSLLSCPLGLLA